MKKKLKPKSTTIENKKAFHEYQILSSYEAGIVLSGWEVKSLRLGRASLKDSHVKFVKNEAFLVNMHIHPYQFTRIEEIEETRSRKLLLNKHQIIELQTSSQQKGLSIIPIKVYPKGQLFKVNIALSRGKKVYEKREIIRDRDINREAAVIIKKAFRD